MSNQGFLSPLNFKFQLKKLPNFVDYVQSVKFPDVVMGSVSGISNPFQSINIPGEHMEFGRLVVYFKLDVDMKNYLEIFDWIVGLAKPDNFDQYRILHDKPIGSGDGPQVDATLTILNAESKPNVEFYFSDVFPKNISGFELDYKAESSEPISCHVEFSYNSFEYKIL